MRKEDETAPFESGGENPAQPPEPETPAAPSGTEAEEPGAPQQDAPAETAEQTAELEPSVEPPPDELPAPQKKSSAKRFLVLFFGTLFLGLCAAVYFLVEERAKTLDAIEEKLAQLDSRLSALRQEGGAGLPGATAQDLAALRQEFQTFQEQVRESLNARQAAVAEPSAGETATTAKTEPVAEEPEEDAEPQMAAVENPPPATEPHTATLEPKPTAEEPEMVAESKPVAKSVEPPAAPPEPAGHEVSLQPPRHVGGEPKEVPGGKVERSREAQEYINFVESTASQLSHLVRKGFATLRDYLAALLG